MRHHATSYAERDELIRAAVGDGLRQTEVAHDWGLTRARVNQIVLAERCGRRSSSSRPFTHPSLRPLTCVCGLPLELGSDR